MNRRGQSQQGASTAAVCGALLTVMALGGLTLVVMWVGIRPLFLDHGTVQVALQSMVANASSSFACGDFSYPADAITLTPWYAGAERNPSCPYLQEEEAINAAMTCLGAVQFLLDHGGPAEAASPIAAYSAILAASNDSTACSRVHELTAEHGDPVMREMKAEALQHFVPTTVLGSTAVTFVLPIRLGFSSVDIVSCVSPLRTDTMIPILRISVPEGGGRCSVTASTSATSDSLATPRDVPVEVGVSPQPALLTIAIVVVLLVAAAAATVAASLSRSGSGPPPPQVRVNPDATQVVEHRSAARLRPNPRSERVPIRRSSFSTTDTYDVGAPTAGGESTAGLDWGQLADYDGEDDDDDDDDDEGWYGGTGGGGMNESDYNFDRRSVADADDVHMTCELRKESQITLIGIRNRTLLHTLVGRENTEARDVIDQFYAQLIAIARRKDVALCSVSPRFDHCIIMSGKANALSACRTSLQLRQFLDRPSVAAVYSASLTVATGEGLIATSGQYEQYVSVSGPVTHDLDQLSDLHDTLPAAQTYSASGSNAAIRQPVGVVILGHAAAAAAFRPDAPIGCLPLDLVALPVHPDDTVPRAQWSSRRDGPAPPWQVHLYKPPRMAPHTTLPHVPHGTRLELCFYLVDTASCGASEIVGLGRALGKTLVALGSRDAEGAVVAANTVDEEVAYLEQNHPFNLHSPLHQRIVSAALLLDAASAPDAFNRSLAGVVEDEIFGAEMLESQADDPRATPERVAKEFTVFPRTYDGWSTLSVDRSLFKPEWPSTIHKAKTPGAGKLRTPFVASPVAGASPASPLNGLGGLASAGSARVATSETRRTDADALEIELANVIRQKEEAQAAREERARVRAEKKKKEAKANKKNKSKEADSSSGAPAGGPNLFDFLTHSSTNNDEGGEEAHGGGDDAPEDEAASPIAVGGEDEEDADDGGGCLFSFMAPAPAALSLSDDDEDDGLMEGSETEPREFDDVHGNRWKVSSKMLGSGAFGNVFLGMGNEGQLVAIKAIRISLKSKDECKNIVKEIRLLSRLRSDRMVQYVSTAVVGSFLMIVMEAVGGGSLLGVIQQYASLPQKLVVAYLKDVLLGLKYLHSNGVVHRDIKPHNVLMSQTGRCKLADFGTACHVSYATASEKAGDITGTIVYMSPEACDAVLHVRSDLWSAGIMAYQMVAKRLPYHQADLNLPFAILNKLGKRDPSQYRPNVEDAPAWIRKLLDLCLEFDPDLRPSADDLLRHSALTETLTASPAIPTSKPAGGVAL